MIIIIVHYSIQQWHTLTPTIIRQNRTPIIRLLHPTITRFRILTNLIIPIPPLRLTTSHKLGRPPKCLGHMPIVRISHIQFIFDPSYENVGRVAVSISIGGVSGHVFANVEVPCVVKVVGFGAFFGPLLGGVAEVCGPLEGDVGFSFFCVAVMN